VGTSTPNLMAMMDAVDSHAYWQHPQFEKSWGSPWKILNSSMVGAADGGNIGSLAVKRVSGKPFTVTEYNHPSPNTFGSEAMPMLAAYAAFQDWDAIFAYTYADGTLSWSAPGMRGFFDWDRDPGKFMAFLPAACFFRRADISPARQTVTAFLDAETERGLLPSARSWRLVDGEHAGLRPAMALLHKLTLALTRGASAEQIRAGQDAELPAGGKYTTDTGEITWDTGAKVLTVNTARSRMVLGAADGKSFTLDGITISPSASLQGWAMVTLTAMSGDSLTAPGAKILVTATGLVTGAGMEYLVYPDKPAGFPPPSGQYITLGKPGWGPGPAMAEGIACRITLPVKPESLRAFALDASGARKAKLEAIAAEGGTMIELSPKHETLWYEVERE
jgi:hypothetical protein